MLWDIEAFETIASEITTFIEKKTHSYSTWNEPISTNLNKHDSSNSPNKLANMIVLWSDTYADAPMALPGFNVPTGKAVRNLFNWSTSSKHVIRMLFLFLNRDEYGNWFHSEVCVSIDMIQRN